MHQISRISRALVVDRRRQRVPYDNVIHIAVNRGLLDVYPIRRTLARREWQRFLAVRLSAAQARPMNPLLNAGAVAVVDRHYNSMVLNDSSRPNVYAVNVANSLAFRYISFDSGRVILRPHAIDHPVELLRLGTDESPSTCIVGRVCLAINEL